MVKSKAENVNVDKTGQFGKTAAKKLIKWKEFAWAPKQDSVTSVKWEMNEMAKLAGCNANNANNAQEKLRGHILKPQF